MPQLVATYNEKLASDDRVELVMMNRDTGPGGEAKALAWAKKEKFPWPIVLPSVKDWNKKFSFMQYRNRYVPQYILIDKDGEKVAEGLHQALKFLGIETK